MPYSLVRGCKLKRCHLSLSLSLRPCCWGFSLCDMRQLPTKSWPCKSTRSLMCEFTRRIVHIRIDSETVFRSTGVSASGFKRRGFSFIFPCDFLYTTVIRSIISIHLDQALVITFCVCVYFIYIPRIHRLPHLDHHTPVYVPWSSGFLITLRFSPANFIAMQV